MLSKSTLIKVAVGVLVVGLIWSIMKLRHKRRTPKVIVTAMPILGTDAPVGQGGDDLFDQVTKGPAKEQYADYADWQDAAAGSDSEDDASDGGDDASDDEEGFAEYSDVNFKSDLLDN